MSRSLHASDLPLKTSVTYLHQHLFVPNHRVTTHRTLWLVGPLINSIRSLCASQQANGTKVLIDAPRRLKNIRTSAHKYPRCATKCRSTKLRNEPTVGLQESNEHGQA